MSGWGHRMNVNPVFKIEGPRDDSERRQSYRKIELTVERHYAPFGPVPWILSRRGWSAPSARASWVALDVVDKEDVMEIIADLPGIDPDQIKISLLNNVLSIQGERRLPVLQQGDRIYQRGRFHGVFSKDLVLPVTQNLDKATAEYSDGVLVIRLWKTQ